MTRRDPPILFQGGPRGCGQGQIRAKEHGPGLVLRRSPGEGPILRQVGWAAPFDLQIAHDSKGDAGRPLLHRPLGLAFSSSADARRCPLMIGGSLMRGHRRMVREVERLFPGHSVDSEQPPSVLVPGAGLGKALSYTVLCFAHPMPFGALFSSGRLCLDLAAKGFEVQGNEFSYFMLLASSFVLNRSPEAECWTIFPWVHSNLNTLSDRDQLRGVGVAVPVFGASTLLSWLPRAACVPLSRSGCDNPPRMWSRFALGRSRGPATPSCPQRTCRRFPCPTSTRTRACPDQG